MKCAILLLALFAKGWPAIAAAAAIAFFFDVTAPVECVLIARWTPGSRRGLAYGIRNGIGTVAAPLGVLLVSRLYSETIGFRLLFILLAALVAVIFAAAVLLPAEVSKPAKAGS